MEPGKLTIMEPGKELSVFAPTSFEQVEKLAQYIADSGMFGIKSPAQAVTLMMIAKDDGQTLSQVMRRYHLHEDGKLSQRASYTQADFEKDGAIIWHVRTDDMVAATFIRTHDQINEEVIQRATDRFKLQWKLEAENDLNERTELMSKLAGLARAGEVTIIRTLVDAMAKGITEGSRGMKSNWKTSPRQMLTARVITEGVGVVDPSRLAGLYDEDTTYDIIAQEKKAKLEKMSVEEIIAMHRKNAADTKYPEEKKRLLGLASELECKLADDKPISNEPTAIQDGDALPGIPPPEGGFKIEPKNTKKK